MTVTKEIKSKFLGKESANNILLSLLLNDRSFLSELQGIAETIANQKEVTNDKQEPCCNLLQIKQRR